MFRNNKLAATMPNNNNKNNVKRSESVLGVGEKGPGLVVMENSINSPLQRFSRAKKRINQIFEEILKYLKESRIYLIECDICEKSNMDTRKDLKRVDAALTQVLGITDVLKRDHMKVAFFGRTSNGKSTVINAMLSDRILPVGIGHTTNCFVSVIGVDGNDAYMEDTSQDTSPDRRKSVDSLQQLAHALHNQKLDSSSLLKVSWPKTSCPLLKDDVVFVDSPGIDVTPDLDVWIDKHCQNADVFVLVVNSESTINHTEKTFFHKVNEKLSKPNIFILNNRWDASAEGEPEMIKLVRQQHLERTTEFLVDDLKCVSKEESGDRIFFVSALETLRHRISQKKMASSSQSPPHRQSSIDDLSEFDENAYRMGKVARRQEFEDFELKFKECISKSAIVTKFNSHTFTGLHISREMAKIMEQVLARASSQKQWCKAEYQDLQETLDYMTMKLKEVSEIIKDKIGSIGEEVEMQVTKAMSDEIRRLAHLVGDFDFPFHPHKGFLRNYKKELHGHIEKGLGKNLKARCSAPLVESIEEYKREMQDQIFGLIPASACSSTISVSPKSSFNVSYELDIPNLCSNFQEDINFKFSCGWTSLIGKFVAPRNPRLALLLGASVKAGMMHTQQLTAPFREDNTTNASEKEMSHLQDDNMADSFARYDEDELTVAVIQGLSSLGSTTAMGFVAVAGLVWKVVGLKLIAMGICTYGAIYLYERAMWTNKAKERVFKKQFVEYSSAELQRIVSFTSKGCSHQIQQELTATFAQLASQVDYANEKIQDQVRELDEEIKRLEDIESNAKVYKNKSTWLVNELTSFVKEFNLLDLSRL